jgi:hypothetical protein
MDLVTLVTACALTVDPKIMHALIWHQSGGEPWSFTVPGERQPQVYRNVADVIRAAHATYPADVAIRVGLTGLSASPRSATAAMFASCANITLAAQQIAQFAERCETSPRLKGDPICCAIAVYRGSWERPDNGFANAVRTSVANNDAPDFEMPANTRIDAAGMRAAPQSALHNTTTPPPAALDDRERGWSSALFPAKSRPSDRYSIDSPASDRPAAQPQESDGASAHPRPAPPHADSLLVPRSTQRSPQ